MVSVSDWRKHRIVEVVAPSGDKYTVERPDPISLTQFWITECGIENPLGEKELSERILKNPEILTKLLIRYVIEPKVTLKSTSKSLSVKELMNDQMDSMFLIREILYFLMTRPDEVINFFRTLQLSIDGRGT